MNISRWNNLVRSIGNSAPWMLFLVLFNSVESITHGGPARLTSTVFTEHPWKMMIPKMEQITTEMTMAHVAAVSLLKNMFRKKPEIWSFYDPINCDLTYIYINWNEHIFRVNMLEYDQSGCGVPILSNKAMDKPWGSPNELSINSGFFISTSMLIYWDCVIYHYYYCYYCYHY